MNKRKYSLDDIKDYLYEEYDLDWKDLKISRDNQTRRVCSTDFYCGDRLSVMAIVYKKNHLLGTKILHVSNDSLQISGYPKEVEDWQDFFAHRHNVDQNLTK